MYNDFNSKKYIILLIIVCALFSILIIKAFDYLPETITSAESAYKTPASIVSTEKEKVSQEQASEEKTSKTDYKPEQKQGVIYKNPDSLSEEPKTIEEIDAPKGVLGEEFEEIQTVEEVHQASPDELAYKSVINARKYLKRNDFTSALNEFQKAAEN